MIREQKIMLDRDLAELYAVPTKVFNQAIKRNRDRFPADFMFQLTAAEERSLRSQFVTSNAGRGGSRYRPYAFTQEGVAMLSSVLKSERAVQVNIAVMRAFAPCVKWRLATEISRANWASWKNGAIPMTITSRSSLTRCESSFKLQNRLAGRSDLSPHIVRLWFD